MKELIDPRRFNGRTYVLACVGLLAGGTIAAGADQNAMLRAAIKQDPPAMNITTGHEIPSEGYCDQPYVVKSPDGTWL